MSPLATDTPADGRHACRRRGITAAVVLLGLVPAACGNAEDASLCTVFDQFLDARAKVQAIDPSEENAGEAIELTEAYLAGVQRLEHSADGRYAQELNDLETAVNDVLLTLESIPEDASFDTWGPLIEDDLEIAADAAQQVEDAIAPSCAGSSDTSDTSQD